MLFLVLFFTISGSTFVQSFYFMSFLLPVVIGTTYYFNKILVPEYLMKEKYGYFGLYLLYAIIISLYLQMLIIYFSLMIFLNYQLEGRNILTINLLSLTLMMYLFVIINAFIHIFLSFKLNSQQVQDLENNIENNKVKSILVKANRKQNQVFLDDLLFIESLGDYIKINMYDGGLTSKEKISAIEQRLPDRFIRIHRSFIINTNKIDSFNKEQVLIRDQVIPISRTYKKQTLEILNKQ